MFPSGVLGGLTRRVVEGVGRGVGQRVEGGGSAGAARHWALANWRLRTHAERRRKNRPVRIKRRRRGQVVVVEGAGGGVQQEAGGAWLVSFCSVLFVKLANLYINMSFMVGMSPSQDFSPLFKKFSCCSLMSI